MTDLLAALPQGPFARLATLLGDIKPGKEPISLSIGDPSGQVPAFVAGALAGSVASFGNYPAINGTEDWRQAAAGWLNTRFALNGAIDPEKHLLPLNGTREGLYLSLFPLMPLSKNGGKPVVAMPNPFYQCYAAAAISAGAEPLYVAAREENGFLPDYTALPEETLKRLVAVYICSPSNPEGAAAPETYWKALFALADKYDFTVLADECYADIYYGTAPASALPMRLAASRQLCAPAELSFLVQAVRIAGPAFGHCCGRSGPDPEIARLPQCGGAASARAHSGCFGRRLARREACRRRARRLWRKNGGGGTHSGQSHEDTRGRLFPLA